MNIEKFYDCVVYIQEKWTAYVISKIRISGAKKSYAKFMKLI